MLLHIQQTISDLKQKIRNNIALISKNREAINRMTARSCEFAGQYEEYLQQNRELLSENNDLINVQQTLLNFLEKYKETAILKEEVPLQDIYSVTNKQEHFILTIKEIVPFNDEHPYYNNTEFIEKLLQYYKNIQDMEKCQELTCLKENVL